MIAEVIEDHGFGLVVEVVNDFIQAIADVFAVLRELVGIFVIVPQIAGGAFRFLVGG